jgi:hypothetical protein
MSPKKKSRRKPAKSKAATAKKKTKSAAQRNKRNAKAQTRRKSTAKKTSGKKAAPKRRARSKPAFRNAGTEIKRDLQRRNRIASEPELDAQSGDLQGISRVEQDDSESVEELVEEGNVFEAGAVAGVEQADNADEREVRTHELPEDDVPEEYWDKE